MAGTLRTTGSIVHACAYEVVWCPKYRRPVLDAAIARRLEEIIRDIAHAHDAEVAGVTIAPALVHVAVEVGPHFGIHNLVRDMKRRSSRLLRAEFPALSRRLPTLWTRHYCCISTAGASTDLFADYGLRQRGV
jgi:putative transposase